MFTMKTLKRSYLPFLKMSKIDTTKKYAQTYRIAMESDREQVLKFLQKHYYPNEPTSRDNDPGYKSIEDGTLMTSFIMHGTSILAVDKADHQKLVGAVITGPISPDEGDKLIAESKRTTSKEWSQDLHLMAHLRKRFNIHEHFNVTKVLHTYAIVVDQNVRGRPISYELGNRCISLAKVLNYELISADCTSSYSTKLCEKLGSVCVSQIAYADYKDLNGVQIFRPPLPHTHIKTFVYFL